MNVELVAQMFKNYQSNVLFHLEGMIYGNIFHYSISYGANMIHSYRQLETPIIGYWSWRGRRGQQSQSSKPEQT